MVLQMRISRTCVRNDELYTLFPARFTLYIWRILQGGRDRSDGQYTNPSDMPTHGGTKYFDAGAPTPPGRGPWILETRQALYSTTTAIQREKGGPTTVTWAVCVRESTGLCAHVQLIGLVTPEQLVSVCLMPPTCTAVT